MTAGATRTAIRDAARKYLASAPGLDARTRHASVLDDPRPVLTPDRRPHSWVVGVSVDSHPVGFVQVLLDGTIMRYSAFPGRPRSDTPSPGGARPAQARQRIGTAVPGSEIVEEPFLTFDRNPDRLVWAAIVKTPQGTQRLMFVAGDSVYEAPTRTDTIG
jgi:hypothetical protein